MISIGLVDDHQLFRKSLSVMLNTIDGLSVIYDTDNGKDLLDFLNDKSLDIALLDIQMPLMDGYELCKLLRSKFPKIKILVVSQITTREAVHKVMEIGANGFFTKNSPPEQLEIAIRSVMKKDYYFDMALSAVLREAILWEKNLKNKTFNINKDHFTGREMEIIKLSCKEFCCKEIANQLYISLRTVEKHRNNIMEKTNSKNFIGSILFALKNEFILLEEI